MNDDNVVGFDFAVHNAQMLEWNAWKTMCRVLKHYGIDVNETDREIVQAISNWGYRQWQLANVLPDHDGKPPFYSAGVEARLEEKYPEE